MFSVYIISIWGEVESICRDESIFICVSSNDSGIVMRVPLAHIKNREDVNKGMIGKFVRISENGIIEEIPNDDLKIKGDVNEKALLQQEAAV